MIIFCCGDKRLYWCFLLDKTFNIFIKSYFNFYVFCLKLIFVIFYHSSIIQKNKRRLRNPLRSHFRLIPTIKIIGLCNKNVKKPVGSFFVKTTDEFVFLFLWIFSLCYILIIILVIFIILKIIVFHIFFLLLI